MAFYHAFTSPRVTELYLPALVATLRTQDATAGVAVGKQPPPETVYTVKKNTAWTQQQINFTQNAINNAPVITPQLIAKSAVDGISLFDRAFFLTLVDQINVLRTQLGLPAVTPAQAFQAIKNKVDIL